MNKIIGNSGVIQYGIQPAKQRNLQQSDETGQFHIPHDLRYTSIGTICTISCSSRVIETEIAWKWRSE